MPEPVAACAGHRVGRGDEGIGAVVDVEQRPLRALEQDAFAGLRAWRRAAPRRCRHRAARRRGCPSSRRAASPDRPRRRPSPRLQRIVMGEQPLDLGRQRRRGWRDPVRGWRGGRPCPRRPGRCRASSCRWPLRPRPSRAARSSSPCRGRISVAFSAIRRLSRRDRDAHARQRLDLLSQRPGIDDDAVADDRELAGANDARRQQRELVGLVADDERVAGVVAALEADDAIGALRQPVDDLALALVAPLRADDHDVGHVSGSFSRRGAGTRTAPGRTPGAVSLYRRMRGGGEAGGGPIGNAVAPPFGGATAARPYGIDANCALVSGYAAQFPHPRCPHARHRP